MQADLKIRLGVGVRLVNRIAVLTEQLCRSRMGTIFLKENHIVDGKLDAGYQSIEFISLLENVGTTGPLARFHAFGAISLA
jgi:hypothetical protein